jgi:hypothetical protein
MTRFAIAFAAGFALAGCGHAGEPARAMPSEDWLRAPAVDSSLAVPKDGNRVLAHALANGTQNYACTSAPGDAGVHYAWTLTGPEATLSGAGGTPMGKHFPSAAGAAAPQWQTPDGTYVVARKVAAFTPTGATGSVPWLLLHVESHGGTGPLGQAQYVQRVNTHGGVAPATGCDATHAGAAEKVPYRADYFFFGS